MRKRTVKNLIRRGVCPSCRHGFRSHPGYNRPSIKRRYHYCIKCHTAHYIRRGKVDKEPIEERPLKNEQKSG